MQDNLPYLRDIHLPGGVSAFPPAYGWWVILGGIILSVLIYKLIFFYIKKSKKRFALKLINSLKEEEIISSSVKISELLRRICVYKYKEAVTLSGSKWIEFLNSKSPQRLSINAAKLLANSPYLPLRTDAFGKEDFKDLQNFAKAWVGENL